MWVIITGVFFSFCSHALIISESLGGRVLANRVPSLWVLSIYIMDLVVMATSG